MAYFTLITKEPGSEKWHIQFGDYDKQCVKDERDSMKEDHGVGFPKGTQFKIIQTRTCRQKEIDLAIEAMS